MTLILQTLKVKILKADQPQVASLSAQNNVNTKSESNPTIKNSTNSTNTSKSATQNTKVSNTQANNTTTESNNKVSTFSSVAKPRMMYAVNKKTTSSLPKYTPSSEIFNQ